MRQTNVPREALSIDNKHYCFLIFKLKYINLYINPLLSFGAALCKIIHVIVGGAGLRRREVGLHIGNSTA
jgi:hypothetical protein